MTKPTTTSTLNRLAVVLAAGVTFMAAADIASASAKGDHHQRDEISSNGSNKRVRPNFAISGQPVDVKHMRRHHDGDKKHDKFTERKKKHCEKMTAPTKHCSNSGGTTTAGNPGKPGSGGTTTAGNPGKPGSGNPANPPSTPGTITITDVSGKTSTLPDVPGKFNIVANTNTQTIDIYSDDKMVSVVGSYVTIKDDSLSKTAIKSSGLKEIDNRDGTHTFVRDTPVATSPVVTSPVVTVIPTKPTKPAGNGGGGDGAIVGTIKDIGNGVEDLASDFFNWGGPTPPSTSTIRQQ